MRTSLRIMCMAMGVLLCTTVWADETITVTANDNEISAQLDLKAVASVFAEAANLEEFEKALNDPESRISNLDLNGDGDVDYLRVVEANDNNRHLILLQAVLAKDIFQDVASIFVEKDERNQVVVQIVGDEYIYGTNYIIEPVFLTRPLMYDYLFFYHDPWFSPYYWDFYPPYWHHYHCWHYHDYWHHIYAYHHCHPHHSYRHPVEPRPHYHEMHQTTAPAVSRRDFATRHPEQSFASRNAGRGIRNAASTQPAKRDLQPARATAGQTVVTNASRTFNSTNTRVAATPRTTTTSRTSTSSTSSSTSRPSTSSRTSTASTTSRTTTTSRPSASSSTSRATSTSTSSTVRSSSSATTQRTSAPVRSTSSSSTVRSTSSSTPVRSTGTYSGSTSTSRPAPSTSSRPAPSTSGSSSRPSGGNSSGRR